MTGIVVMDVMIVTGLSRSVVFLFSVVRHA